MQCMQVAAPQPQQKHKVWLRQAVTCVTSLLRCAVPALCTEAVHTRQAGPARCPGNQHTLGPLGCQTQTRCTAALRRAAWAGTARHFPSSPAALAPYFLTDLRALRRHTQPTAGAGERSRSSARPVQSPLSAATSRMTSNRAGSGLAPSEAEQGAPGGAAAPAAATIGAAATAAVDSAATAAAVDSDLPAGLWLDQRCVLIVTGFQLTVALSKFGRSPGPIAVFVLLAVCARFFFAHPRVYWRNRCVAGGCGCLHRVMCEVACKGQAGAAELAAWHPLPALLTAPMASPLLCSQGVAAAPATHARLPAI